MTMSGFSTFTCVSGRMSYAMWSYTGATTWSGRSSPPQKRKERSSVVALGKPLAVHQPARFEHVVRMEKTVGGDQVDLGVIRPTGEQRLEMRANVDFPTATEPATPMTYGTLGAIEPRKVDDTRCRSWVALTYRFNNRLSGR